MAEVAGKRANGVGTVSETERWMGMQRRWVEVWRVAGWDQMHACIQKQKEEEEGSAKGIAR